MMYAETIEYLFGIRLFGQKLGLETMRYLLELLGDPQDSLRFIHIAGTNGKGSVAAMCHSVLTAAGYKTGLYTSPHLVSFCERFQINGRSIAEGDIVRLVEQLRPVLDRITSHPEFRQPTFFEAVTTLALQYFRERNVEVVVWETGLGGRLDATNIVTPLVSVITNIAFDHTQYLGETLAQIAGEKAGIIKPRVPVVTATTDSDALAVIRGQAALLQCPVTVVGEDAAFRTPLLGRHQIVNCATAVAALMATGLEIGEATLREGLAHTRWPGRFQVAGNVVLDGAHNADAARHLADTLHEHFPGKRLGLVLGVLRDKNYDEMCRILAPLAETIGCTRVNSERTSDPRELAELCRQANRLANVSVCADIGQAIESLRQACDIVVITGSLFLVGEAMQRLGLTTPATSERELVLQ
jgi:dihydrofolate synthase/folylpolyglutamate synthase